MYPVKLKIIPAYFIFSCIFTYQLVGQQNILEKKISLDFRDKTLVEIINNISRLSGVNFSFDGNIIPQDVKISRNYDSQTLDFILSDLLLVYQIGYKPIKNQVILYRLSNSNENSISISKKSDAGDNIKTGVLKDNFGGGITNQRNNIFYDTIRVFVPDTQKISLYDTVVYKFIDTLIIHDTVLIKENIRTENKPKNKPRQKNSLGIEINGGVLQNYYLLTSDLASEISDRARSMLSPAPGYVAGLRFPYNFKNFLVQPGFEYISTRQHFFLSTTENDNYIRIDTIEKYYTGISDGDTNWVYITEEREIEREIIRNYNRPLSYNYIQIPLVIGYQVDKKSVKYEFKAGLVPGFYLNKKGFEAILIDTLNNKITENINSPISSLRLSFYFSVGINYNLNNKVNLVIEPSYYQDIFSVYRTENLNKLRFYSPGIKMCLRYKIF